MITSGIDIVKIERIEKAISNPRFRTKYFGENELREITARGDKPQSYAAAFAAKEAFAKAMGTGLRGFLLCEVEVLHDELGAPHLRLGGKALRLAEKKGLELSLSISHERDYAVAVVFGISKKQ